MAIANLSQSGASILSQNRTLAPDRVDLEFASPADQANSASNESAAQFAYGLTDAEVKGLDFRNGVFGNWVTEVTFDRGSAKIKGVSQVNYLAITTVTLRFVRLEGSGLWQNIGKGFSDFGQLWADMGTNVYRFLTPNVVTVGSGRADGVGGGSPSRANRRTIYIDWDVISLITLGFNLRSTLSDHSSKDMTTDPGNYLEALDPWQGEYLAPTQPVDYYEKNGVIDSTWIRDCKSCDYHFVHH